MLTIGMLNRAKEILKRNNKPGVFIFFCPICKKAYRNMCPKVDQHVDWILNRNQNKRTLNMKTIREDVIREVQKKADTPKQTLNAADVSRVASLTIDAVIARLSRVFKRKGCSGDCQK